MCKKGKEQQELPFHEGPGADVNVPVQNSVCCWVKRDPLSGWRPHDAQEDDISMKLCERPSRGSPDAQRPHSSHLQGRAGDVNHADCDLVRWLPVTCSVRRTLELYSDQNTTKQHPNTRAVAHISDMVQSVLAVRTPRRRNSAWPQ